MENEQERLLLEIHNKSYWHSKRLSEIKMKMARAGEIDLEELNVWLPLLNLAVTNDEKFWIVSVLSAARNQVVA